MTRLLLLGLTWGLLQPQTAAQTVGLTAQASPLPGQANFQPASAQVSRYQVLHVNPTAGSDRQGTGAQRQPLQTITYALQVAQPNTIILLAPGLYSQASGETFPLRLKPGVTIQGAPASAGHTAVIQGGGEFVSPVLSLQNVAIVAADRAGLAHVTVTNPNAQGHGLWIESGSPVILENVFAGSGHSGIFLAGTGAPVIRGNYFYRNAIAGLVIYGESQAEIHNNRFEQTGAGITVSQNATPRIIGNQIIRNREGMVLLAGARPILQNNDISQNRRNGLVEFGDSATLATARYAGPVEPVAAVSSAVSPSTAAANPDTATRAIAATTPTSPPTTSAARSPSRLEASANLEARPYQNVISITANRPQPDNSAAANAASAVDSPSPTTVDATAALSADSPNSADPVATPNADSSTPTAIAPAASLPALPTVALAAATTARTPPEQLPASVAADPSPATVSASTLDLAVAPPLPSPPAIANLSAEAPANAPEPAASNPASEILATPSPATDPAAESIEIRVTPAQLPAAASLTEELAAPLPEAAIAATGAVEPGIEIAVIPASNELTEIPVTAESQPDWERIFARLDHKDADTQSAEIASPTPADSANLLVPPAATQPDVVELTVIPAAAEPEPLPASPPTLPTDLARLPAVPNSDLLLVPGPDIPIGSGGGVPYVFVSADPGSNAAGPPPPPSRATALGLYYRVIVEAADEATQAQVRSLVPDAFRIRYRDQVMMQAGAFEDQAMADDIVQMLANSGLRAWVENLQ
ncbi:MAG: DUF1565 domain-containing protein [Almyronema sp.]